MNNYPNLLKALGNNPELLKNILDKYGNNVTYLQYLETIFLELYQNSCKGVDTKILECSPDDDKFRALLSEFEFARYFCKKEMNVELLSEHVFNGRPAPDMYVVDKTGEYFVEVKNIQQDSLDFDLGVRIAEELTSRGLSFDVVISTSPSLSTSTYTYQTRHKKESYAEIAFQEFMIELDRFKNRDIPTLIKTSQADIGLSKTNKGRSRLTMGTSKEAVEEPNDYKQRIKYDILKKAEKRKAWTGDELDKRYIIAVDDPTLGLVIDDYNFVFFGNAVTYLSGRLPSVSRNSDINDAVKLGWTKYLERMFVLPSGSTVIPDSDRGICFTDPLTKNLTAIIVTNNKIFYLLANPFAEQKINSPDVMKVFRDCNTGWEP